MAYLCEKLGFRLVEIPIHFWRIGASAKASWTS